MYAFVSHESAVDALRLLSSGGRRVEDLERWPPSARCLPPVSECVSGQRDLRGSRAEGSLRSLGLSARPVDLMVGEKGARSDGRGARFHVWRGLLPAGSLLVAGPDLLISGPELAVIELCSSQGKLDALLDAHVAAVRAETGVLADLGVDERPVIDHPLEWERIRRLVAATAVACELAGTYRLGVDGREVRYGVPPLMSARSLAHAAGQLPKISGTHRAKVVSELMVDGSASPMETTLALLLSLPQDFGGFGLARPRLNQRIDVSDLRGCISDRDVVTPDLVWPDEKVALEYDSAEFHAGSGTARPGEDAVRWNILTAIGYRVLRATPQTVRTPRDLELLARQVAHLLGIELGQPTPVQGLRRRKLYAQLMPQVRRG